jgi:hypothetical protein
VKSAEEWYAIRYNQPPPSPKSEAMDFIRAIQADALSAPPRTSNAEADADEAQKHQFGSAVCGCAYCRNTRKKEEAK